MKIGLFGGTFDPPHHGHLIVASEAYDALGLDRLIFVPAATPPHKETVATPAEVRLRMVEAAIDRDERFAVDDLELRRGGVSYTVDTLREYTARHPDAELVFLLGIDQFRGLSTWREPREVARLATLAVMGREGETVPTDGPYQGVEVRVSRIDISATLIRDRIARGRSIRYFVPDAVRAIIEEDGPYLRKR